MLSTVGIAQLLALLCVAVEPTSLNKLIPNLTSINKYDTQTKTIKKNHPFVP